jgi:L-ascorbate metabolism protein UlaG (beta-lactamase superfamily)
MLLKSKDAPMKITWYGHSAFRLDFADKAVLIDPFFTGNPAFEGDRAKILEGVSHVLLTHGHGDHVGDTLEIAKQTGAKVVTNFELCMYLAEEGLQNFDPMNTGGTTDQDGFTVTLVRADHSAGLVEMGVNYPLGSANGIIVKAPGEPTVYHMGDTDIFGDMGLIAEIHQPDVVIVPIGDRFTMGPEVAALAVQRFFSSAKAVIPCHYASFPPLVPNADRFVAAMEGKGIQVVVPHKTVGVKF